MNVRQITLGSCIAAQPAQVDRNTTGDPDFLTLPKFVLAMGIGEGRSSRARFEAVISVKHGSLEGFTALQWETYRPYQFTEMCRMVVTLQNFTLAMPVDGRFCSTAPFRAL